MDFKQLKSFAAVVEYQNFSKAADHLHIAQPTISTHIRMLEEELNTRLILRTTKSIEITPQGWDAYRYAIKILDLRTAFWIPAPQIPKILSAWVHPPSLLPIFSRTC